MQLATLDGICSLTTIQGNTHWSLMADTRIRYQASSRKIHGGQSDTGRGFPSSISLIVPYHSTDAPNPYFTHLPPTIYNPSNSERLSLLLLQIQYTTQ